MHIKDNCIDKDKDYHEYSKDDDRADDVVGDEGSSPDRVPSQHQKRLVGASEQDA